MSDSTNKDRKVKTEIEDSTSDVKTTQADLEKSSTSGSPCICKTKREISCPLHGG